MRPLAFTLKPCKLGGIVLTFQGFWADVSRPPLPPQGEHGGKLLKSTSASFDVAWLENKGAYSLAVTRRSAGLEGR